MERNGTSQSPVVIETSSNASKANEIVVAIENYQDLWFSRLLALFDESSLPLNVFDLEDFLHDVLKFSTCQMKTDPRLAPNSPRQKGRVTLALLRSAHIVT